MPKMQIVVNADFHGLRQKFTDIAESFDEVGQTIYQGRNTVKLVDFSGVSLVVKRYRRLGAIKRIIYKFRSPKAFRAYKHALMLLDMGISTPEPAAYIIAANSLGMPVDGYYICRYTPLPPLEDYLGTPSGGFDKEVVSAFAEFVANLHLRGILFHDLNRTNVLVDKAEGAKPAFSLIDINRMEFKGERPLTLGERLDNITRFCYDRPELFAYFAEDYCEAAKKLGLIDRTLDKEAFVAQAVKEKAKADASRRRLTRLKHPFRG